VLYHRRDHLGCLRQLRETLVQGGQLVLETLVLDQDDDEVLIPENRYAKMRNVWAVPSHKVLVEWVQQAGLRNVRCVDVTPTSLAEQHATEWMTFHSLADFLDPQDASKTCEGYPAPVRAIVIAER